MASNSKWGCIRPTKRLDTVHHAHFCRSQALQILLLVCLPCSHATTWSMVNKCNVASHWWHILASWGKRHQEMWVKKSCMSWKEFSFSILIRWVHLHKLINLRDDHHVSLFVTRSRSFIWTKVGRTIYWWDLLTLHPRSYPDGHYGICSPYYTSIMAFSNARCCVTARYLGKGSMTRVYWKPNCRLQLIIMTKVQWPLNKHLTTVIMYSFLFTHTSRA